MYAIYVKDQRALGAMKTGGINIPEKENRRTDALSLGVFAKSFGSQEAASSDFAPG